MLVLYVIFFLIIIAVPGFVAPITPVVAVTTDAIMLTCTASANPTPMVTWWRNGLRLISSERVEITIMALETSMASSTLTIQGLELADDGVYVCIASNPAGTVNINTSVTVQGIQHASA